MILTQKSYSFIQQLSSFVMLIKQAVQQYEIVEKTMVIQKRQQPYYLKKHPGTISWKLHIPSNISLKSIIDSSNEGKCKIWLTNEVTFEILLGDLEIPKHYYRIFYGSFQSFFSYMMLVKGLNFADE